MVKYVPTYTKGTLEKRKKKDQQILKDSSKDAYAMFLCVIFF